MVQETLNRLIRASFYALIFFLPLSIALVSTFSAFAIFFYMVKRVRAAIASRHQGFTAVLEIFQLPSTPLTLPWTAFIVAAALSLMFSQFPDESLVGFIGKVLRGLYLYAAFLDAFKKTTSIQRFLIVWMTSAFVTALSGLNQYLAGIDFLRGTPLVNGRVASSLRHANDLGAYLVAVCPLVLVLVLNWKEGKLDLRGNSFTLTRNPRFFLFLLATIAAVLLLCLGLTFSRSAWVAFFAAIVLAGLFHKKHMPFFILLVLIFNMVFAPAMIKVRKDIAPGGVAMPVERPRFSLEMAAYAQQNMGNGRWVFWREGWNMFRDHPLWGTGINTYSRMGQRYNLGWGGYPHNSYLQMAAEMGALGLGAFLWLIGAVFWQVWLALRRASSGFTRTALTGVSAGFAALLVQSFFDTTFYSVQLSVLLWLVMALTVSLTKPSN